MDKFELRKKIAQLFLVGIKDKSSVDGVINLIKFCHIGGVVLYKNCYSSLEELVDLINRLKEANKGNELPLTIAIDQEGGRVNRLPKDFLNFPSARKLFLSGYGAITDFSKATSDVLKKLGINMNFAPVLDLESDNKGIGDRSYSSDPLEITKVGSIVCHELLRNNIVPVIKHFPGHGSVSMDSHIFLPIVRNKDLLADDIIPFENLINSGVPCVMVGHLLIKGLTGLFPASISQKFIQNEIRLKYAYDRVIVSDELGMDSVKLFYGKFRALKLAFIAGDDIFCCKYSLGYIEKGIDYLEKYIVKNELYMQLNNAYNRIFIMKNKYNFNDDLITNFSPSEYNDVVKKYIS